MKKFSDISHVGLIILIIVLLIEIIYSINRDLNENRERKILHDKALVKLNRYKVYRKELYYDLLRYGIDVNDKRRIEKLLDELTKTEEEKMIKKKVPLTKQMFKSSRDGIIRGSITGGIMGGLPAAITGGVVFGIINPIMKCWEEL